MQKVCLIIPSMLIHENFTNAYYFMNISYWSLCMIMNINVLINFIRICHCILQLALAACKCFIYDILLYMFHNLLLMLICIKIWYTCIFCTIDAYIIYYNVLYIISQVLRLHRMKFRLVITNCAIKMKSFNSILKVRSGYMYILFFFSVTVHILS